MNKNSMPDAYIGREQAYIKHTILSNYLTRLFMIIGRKESVINYVDCFAGPWKDESDELSNTSIGISISQMAACVVNLDKNFKLKIKFRALYIEKDPGAYRRLEEFVSKQNNPNIDVSCLLGDYTEHIHKIADWSRDYFTFFFIDPKGWKKIIGGVTLEPLLRLKKSEFLINLMYDFANRAISIKKHEDDMIELLGKMPEFFGNEDAYERQQVILNSYRNSVNEFYKGRTAFVPIERPDKDRVLYFLIYLTRHPLGISVFKEVAENMMEVQRVTQLETRLRKQFNQSVTSDMFANDKVDFASKDNNNNVLAAKAYLLERLSTVPTLIDQEYWSTLLEETELFPSDYQLAIKELVKEGKVENLDADIKRRTKNVIKPGWPKKSERWRLL